MYIVRAQTVRGVNLRKQGCENCNCIMLFVGPLYIQQPFGPYLPTANARLPAGRSAGPPTTLETDLFNKCQMHSCFLFVKQRSSLPPTQSYKNYDIVTQNVRQLDNRLHKLCTWPLNHTFWLFLPVPNDFLDFILLLFQKFR